MLLGIDGGGTKTAYLLADARGRLLAEYTGEGTNPADIGLNACEDRLRAQLDALLAPFGGRGAAMDSAYAGIAGSINPDTAKSLREILARLLPNARCVENGSDAFNALYGETPDGEGIALIAGTGSAAFARANGEIFQVGGWGYLVDDAGSGYRMGADALRAAFRAMDGRGKPTLLESACEEKLGVKLSRAVPVIYGGGKRYVASFARTAFDAARAGDEIALEIVKNAAEALAAHLIACIGHIRARPAVCVTSGGLTRNDHFIEMILSALGARAREFSIVRPEVEPVYGALCRAARNAGLGAGEELRANYRAFVAQRGN